MGFPLKLSVAGVVICVVGAAFGWGVFPAIIRRKIYQSKNLDPASDGRKMWEKLPFPLSFKVYLFNVTNRDAVNAGGKPHVEEIGPYIFEEWKEKVDIQDNVENDTVSFSMKSTWIFDRRKSLPLTGDEIITLPHPAMMGIILTAEREQPAYLALVAKALPSMFNNTKDVFLETSAMDLLFHGNYINCSGKAFPVKAVCILLRKKAIFPEISENIFKFSIFGNRNGTAGADRYEVSRGTKDIQTLGQMVSYNGLAEQVAWGGMPCNSISGTDSTIFPPFMEKRDLRTFSADVCRSMVSKFQGTSTFKFIPTYKFTSDFGDMSSYSEEKCFCPQEKCLKKGVMDLTNCQGAPMIASLPHFFAAHKDYQDGVRGLAPNESKHTITTDFEPITGTPLSAKTRIQFSMPIHSINDVNITASLPNTIIPFLWLEEGIDLNDVIVGDLKSKLLNVMNGMDIGKWAVTAGGASTAVVGAVLNQFNPFSSGGT